MQNRKTIWFILLLWVGLGTIKPLFAQNDSGKFTVNKFRTLNESIQSDTSMLKKRIDSLKEQVSKNIHDSLRAKLFLSLANSYSYRNPDSSIRYAQMGLDLYRKLLDKKGEIAALWQFGWLFRLMGDYNKSQEYLLFAQKIATKENLLEVMPSNLLLMAFNVKEILGNYKKSIELTHQALAIGYKLKRSGVIFFASIDLCNYFCELKKVDSATYYYKIALVADSVHDRNLQILISKAKIFECKNEWGKAIGIYKDILVIYKNRGNTSTISYAGNLQSIAEVYQKWGKRDSAIYYADQAFQMVNNTKYFESTFKKAFLLYKLYLQEDKSKALSYLNIANEIREMQWKNNRQFSLRNLEEFDVKERDYETQKAETIYQNNVQRIIFISAISIILIIAVAVYVSNRRHRFLNKELRSQKNQLENSLQRLKETQSQLIQSEKMASLGELTAGIAHEIQNPLNFVNNFSEVNKELLAELNEEIDKGNYEEVKAIAKGVTDNEEKINHHGKRADTIVKGMLQHSRSSSGQKEPTDINALCDEYLRLAYHGLRAKDKDFNATLITGFDESIGKIDLIPQDIGRVVLNLITNSFYAVAEKKKIIGEGYEPTVTVATKKFAGKIQVSVSDNGNGIPPKVLDKIFQPFFTTKPTGQGTGLGLSLSYDIVKAHGGEIKVEAPINGGTSFHILLPINQ